MISLGLSFTEHHQEVPADSIDQIFKLVYHAFEALKKRDDPNLLATHLVNIPADFHPKLNQIAQYGVQVIVIRHLYLIKYIKHRFNTKLMHKKM